jgi:hypothetical protein
MGFIQMRWLRGALPRFSMSPGFPKDARKGSVGLLLFVVVVLVAVVFLG